MIFILNIVCEKLVFIILCSHMGTLPASLHVHAKLLIIVINAFCWCHRNVVAEFNLSSDLLFGVMR